MADHPFIPVAQPLLNGNEKKYVNDCLDTGWISSNGSYITKFEEKFAQFCNVQHAIACCNGTVTLHLALLAYDITVGDEIIVPTLTYIATANAVRYCGATPVFVDSEAETWNIDPKKIEEKITAKTKGIIVVHLYGHPTNMEPIMEIAKKHNLFVIEDAAEAHGAESYGKKVGSIGDISTFSFFGNKILTTGEGGMITTNDDKLAEKMRILKGQGMDPKKRYWFITVGYNYRMTNIEAALGLAQLEKFDWHANRRIEVANWYKKHFADVVDQIEVHAEQPWAKHAYWMSTILLKDTVTIARDDLMLKLKEDNIETRPIFYPMHIMPPYFEENPHYPVAEKIAARGINLPSHGLLTEDDIVYITDRIKFHIK
jgi:perosamine synthetase